MEQARASRWSAAALLAVSLAAGVLAWWLGRFGVILFDHSLVVDGGWRIVHGQVPYADFHTPHGPLTFQLVALALALLGHKWGSVLVLGGVINGLAALLAGSLVLHEGGTRRAVAAAAITGCWFALPFAFPWPDTVAFLAVLGAFAAEAASHRARKVPLEVLLAACAGAAVVAGVLAKHNIGAAGLLALLAVMAVRRRGPRRFASLAAGCLVAGGGFLVYLAWHGAIGAMWEDMVLRGWQAGRSGAPGHHGGWWGYLASGPVLTLLILVALATWAAVAARHRRPLGDAVEIIVLALLGLIASLTGAAPLWMSLPLLGVVIGLLDARYSALLEQRLTRPALVRALRVLLVAGLAAGGVVIGATRVAADYAFAPSRYDFSYRLQTAALRPARMDQELGPMIDRLAEELRGAEGGRVLVFPNASLLYLASDRVAPQPYLYFEAGHSLHERMDDEGRLIDAIEGAGVQRVLLLKELQFPLDDVNYLLTSMPTFASHLQHCFEAGDSGPHHVWLDRRQPAPCQAPPE